MIFFVEDDGSDSSDVEVVELPAGSIPVRGSRGGNRRLPGRGEERSSTGEGTSRGPGELGSNFNPSKNQTNKQSPSKTNKANK